MKRRALSLLCLCLCVVLALSGCGSSSSTPTDAEQKATEAAEPTPMPSPIPLVQLDGDVDTASKKPAAKILTDVETDELIVSVVFEGWSKEDMPRLLELLSGKNVSVSFLVSGVNVDDNREILRKIANAGYEIYNDGISIKGMSDAMTEDAYSHQFEKTAELMKGAGLKTPTVGGLNGARMNDILLRGAYQAGLTGIIRGGSYLNHRSFVTEEDAVVFVQNMLRGTVLVVKIGQELNDEEYGDVDDMLDEKPAIDRQPGLDKDTLETKEREKQDIVEATGWLLDALLAEGYSLVTPVELQKMERSILTPKTELTEEFLATVNPLNYTVPVTENPMEIGTMYTTTPEQFTGVVMVGDSVTESLKLNVEWHRKSNPGYMSGISFLTSGKASVERLLKEPMFESQEAPEDPSEKAELLMVEDALQQLHPRRIYLMLRSDNTRAYTESTYMVNYRLLIKRIKEKNPIAQIVVQSVTPYAASHLGSPTNYQIFRFNLMLCSMCKEYGIPFVDTAFALRDSAGALASSYCLDEMTEGRHLNEAGCGVWLDYLMQHVP